MYYIIYFVNSLPSVMPLRRFDWQSAGSSGKSTALVLSNNQSECETLYRQSLRYSGFKPITEKQGARASNSTWRGESIGNGKKRFRGRGGRRTMG